MAGASFCYRSLHWCYYCQEMQIIPMVVVLLYNLADRLHAGVILNSTRIILIFILLLASLLFTSNLGY